MRWFGSDGMLKVGLHTCRGGLHSILTLYEYNAKEEQFLMMIKL